MRRRLFTFAAGVSAVLCAGVLALSVSAGGYLSSKPTVWVKAADDEVQVGAYLTSGTIDLHFLTVPLLMFLAILPAAWIGWRLKWNSPQPPACGPPAKGTEESGSKLT